MNPNPTTPPTTPPAIAPTFVFFFPGVAVALDEPLVGVGSLVDSGPPVTLSQIALRYSQKKNLTSCLGSSDIKAIIGLK